MSLIKNIIQANRQHNQREQYGIYAICSAHPLVLQASMLQAKKDNSPLLIEATANQVNQFGGYTQMQPKDFYQLVMKLADQCQFDPQQIILGGDHLGPVVWQNENAEQAYNKAHQLIESFIAAGFKKIHLDCSMPCFDDPTPLSDEIIAQRAAALCKTAETTAQKLKLDTNELTYVIGTEVPPPGGANQQINHIEVTAKASALQTITQHKQAFAAAGLSHTWSRVIALVVQPGVEFDNFNVIDYQPQKALELKSVINDVEHLAFEAHSTDYQKTSSYKQLVTDHFAILKVGPQLTFALREALFALQQIEQELISLGQIAKQRASNLKTVIEQEMLAKPQYWQSFYQVEDDKAAQLFRQYSFSDRIRYYWPQPNIQLAVDQLIENLDSIEVPLPLISQYLPYQYQLIQNKQLESTPTAMIIAHIQQVLSRYAAACNIEK